MPTALRKVPKGVCHVVGAAGEWEIEGKDSGPRLVAKYFTFSNETLLPPLLQFYSIVLEFYDSKMQLLSSSLNLFFLSQ